MARNRKAKIQNRIKFKLQSCCSKCKNPCDDIKLKEHYTRYKTECCGAFVIYRIIHDDNDLYISNAPYSKIYMVTNISK